MHKIIFLSLVVVVFGFNVHVVHAASCDIPATIDSLRSELASRSLAVGDQEYSYTEIRAGNAKKKRSDPEMEIILALLNTDTCATQTVTITRRGADIIVPEGYEIEPIQRVNGIRWNDWNTEYRVVRPTEWFLVGNLYPHIQEETKSQLTRAASGKLIRKYVKTRTVTNVFYTPFTKELRTPEFLAGAQVYQTSLSIRVDTHLRREGVFSRAYPDQLVPDVTAIKDQYTERLLPIEHMDFTEFALDRSWSTDRAYGLIAANRDYFGVYTCSPAKACGPRQWTKGTWHLMDQKYPAAGLPDDYLVGARDPFWSAVATRLLHDYNLAELRSRLTASEYATLLDEPHMLEESLAAAYNTGVARVAAVLKAYLAHPQHYSDWIDAKGRGLKGKLVSETKQYIVKLRYVRDEYRPALAAN